MIATHKDLSKKLAELENKYDSQFKVVFDAIRALIAQPEPKKKKIGIYQRKPCALQNDAGGYPMTGAGLN
jgi:hypothetical protein